MEKQLELKGVSLWKGPSAILEGIDLALERGLVYGVLGPNGSGKTCLLRLLNLLETPTSGRMVYAGLDTRESDHTVLRRQMAFVAQHPVMFNCSVFKNVALGLEFRGMNRADRQKKANETLRAFALDNYASRNARTLSGGEKQRVAIARALIVSPEVLLLDEPSANLDAENEAAFELVIEKIKSTRATTIVMVTHEIAQAKRLADRLIFLRNGRVAATGETASLLRTPLPEYLC